MVYEGLQASSWLMIVIYMLVATFFGGISSYCYQEKVIGDYDSEVIIYSALFAPIFFIGSVASVWWGLGAAITGGVVSGIMLAHRLS